MATRIRGSAVQIPQGAPLEMRLGAPFRTEVSAKAARGIDRLSGPPDCRALRQPARSKARAASLPQQLGERSRGGELDLDFGHPDGERQAEFFAGFEVALVALKRDYEFQPLTCTPACTHVRRLLRAQRSAINADRTGDLPNQCRKMQPRLLRNASERAPEQAAL